MMERSLTNSKRETNYGKSKNQLTKFGPQNFQQQADMDIDVLFPDALYTLQIFTQK